MPTEIEIATGLAVVVYPAAAASVGIVLAKLAPPQSRLRQAAMAGAAGAGLITAFIANNGMPKIPIADSIGWIPAGTAVATVVAMLVLTAFTGAAIRVVGAVALGSAAIASLYFAGKPTFAASTEALIPFAAALAGISVIAVIASERVSNASFTVIPWIARIVTASAAALCALWSSSGLLALLIGSTATTAGVIGIGGMVLRLKEPAPLVHGIFIAHIAPLAVYGYLYGGIPLIAIALLAASLLAPPMASLVASSGSTRSRLLRSVAMIALTAALAGGAMAWVHSKIKPDAASANDPANMYR
jgi:hypothetical protein